MFNAWLMDIERAIALFRKWFPECLLIVGIYGNADCDVLIKTEQKLCLFKHNSGELWAKDHPEDWRQGTWKYIAKE